MTYVILILAGTIAGAAIGWFVRHRLLVRQLHLSKKQLDESKSLQITLEHQASTARQKLYEQVRTLSKTTGPANTEPGEDTVLQKKYQDTLEQLETLKRENNDLQDQVGYFNAEKSSWLRYREQAQDEIRNVHTQNRLLQDTISELQREHTRTGYGEHTVTPAAPVAIAKSADASRTPVWEPGEYTGYETEKTAEIATRQKTETDRVVIHDEPKPDPIPEPDPVDVAPEAPARDNAANPDPVKAPVKKKKPKTIRINRSSSDIMDSFKKDLGLPGF